MHTHLGPNIRRDMTERAGQAEILLAVSATSLPLGYAKIGNHIAYFDANDFRATTTRFLSEVNSETFFILPGLGQLAKDDRHVYERGYISQVVADPATFAVLPCRDYMEYGDPCLYSRDRFQVYYLGLDNSLHILRGADSSTFVSCSGIATSPCIVDRISSDCFYDARDNHNTYYGGWVAADFWEKTSPTRINAISVITHPSASV